MLYSPGGQKLGTYQIGVGTSLASTLVSSDIYFGSRRVSTIDRLGSVGKFYPYGEGKGGTNPADTWSFATYWRDSATNLDYANQRYYSSSFGRFMTPDPYKATANGNDPTNPQSWNRYVYTRGDPVNRYDPHGLNDCPADDPCVDGGDDEEDDSDIAFQVQRPPRSGNGGPPLSDETMAKRWNLAVGRALRLLQSNKNCASLFGLTGANGNSSPDPTTVLTQIAGSVSFNPMMPEKSGGITYVWSATTQGVGSNSLPIGDNATMLVNAGVQILVNDAGGSFFNGTMNDQIATVLHELGHAYWDMYGAGTSQITPDGRSAPAGVNGFKASEANTALVKKDCNL